MIDSTSKTAVIELFGNEEECFYQLGLKDRESAEFSLSHIKGLVSTRWDVVNSGIHNIAVEMLDKITIQPGHYENLIKAYSEGLSKRPNEIKYALMVPELCSFISSIKPDLSRLGLGCSSYFTLNNNGEPIHQRILDFPLKDSYDKYERVLINDYKNRKKTFNFSSCGLPFSGLTSMNENGLTLAIHQKFTNHFNQHGQSVFYLAHELIHSCETVEDVKEFLKHHQSITNWNFNCLDKRGRVLSADLCGKSVTFLEHDLEDGPLYICNELLDDDLKQSDFLPCGIQNYNDSRIENAYGRLKKLSMYDLDDANILKYLSTPHRKSKFSIDTITLSSVNSSLFNPNQEMAMTVTGEAPKIFIGQYEKYENIWSELCVQSIEKRFPKTSTLSKESLIHLSKAQSAFDLNNTTKLYHELQMAIERNKATPYEGIAKFYFIVVQYIFEDHHNVLLHLQEELFELQEKLPDYFKELSIIIDQRLSILCSTKPKLRPLFSSEKLNERYINESKNGMVSHKMYKKLTFIHIDIFDVIFL